MKFEFNSRKTYLAYVATWRLQYFDTIAGIRKVKVDFKNAQREFSKHGAFDYKWISQRRADYHGAHAKMENLREEHKSLITEATELITERHLSRQEAGIQMELAREAAST
jgi:hypothetical protein